MGRERQQGSSWGERTVGAGGFCALGYGTQGSGFLSGCELGGPAHPLTQVRPSLQASLPSAILEAARLAAQAGPALGTLLHLHGCGEARSWHPHP